MSKTVSISARISQEDAEFLSGLTIEGAKTPSDKLRALLTEARLQQHNQHDYRSSLQSYQDHFAPTTKQIQQTEFELTEHSELLARLLQWLPDTNAFITTLADSTDGNDATKDAILALEKGCVTRIFNLMESVLQLGITQRNPCYDPNVINEHIGPILELAEVIAHKQKSQTGE